MAATSRTANMPAMAAPTAKLPPEKTSAEAQFAAPTGAKLSKELHSFAQLPRLARRVPDLVRLPRGDQAVMVFPGWSTSDLFLSPLRSALSALGHDAHGWGFGINTGEVERLLPSVENQLAHLVANVGKPAALIGWSLGGIFAREVARNRPDLVSQVITLATPVHGGPKYTRGARSYSQEHIDYIDNLVAERNQIPIQRPVTALYSRADAIVDWRACIDNFSPQIRNIEVHSTHVGMTIDPDVWTVAAELLTSPPRTSAGRKDGEVVK